MSFECSKRVRSILRKLAGVVHERELRVRLEALSRQVECWRRGEIDTWELDKQVHDFANGRERRRLFETYTSNQIVHLNVAGGIARGILRPAEVTDEIRTVLKKEIEYYERGLADGSIRFEEED